MSQSSTISVPCIRTPESPHAQENDPSHNSRASSANIGAPKGTAARFLELIPHEFARRHLVLPFGADAMLDASVDRAEHASAKHIRVFIAASTASAAVHNIGVRLRLTPVARQAAAEGLAAAIDRSYAAQAARSRESTLGGRTAARDDSPVIELDACVDVDADLAAALRDAERDLINTQGKGRTVRLVDLLIFEALQRSASDIHIQPLSDRVVVRYRVDGVLRTVRELPAGLAAAVISRVKVMSRLDVAEQNAPQDGRATVTIGGRAHRVDLRVSTLPTTYGERIVLRLLDTAATPHLLTFAALGMPSAVEHQFLAQLSRSSGIVLVTGPTGSGKTTTLYTSLAWISTTNADTSRAATQRSRACELNIMTIEDPVEYDLSTAGLTVSQTQLNTKKNVTFAAGLRHILRQDPDVIMVGEVRDEETARIAVQASLTGHLVLSTLHTNDAASAVARLLDLGVEPFLVSSSLAAVLAQRLVRLTHQTCQGAGCADCLGTGFKGRRGVFELLVLDAELRRLVTARADAAEIKRTATTLCPRTPLRTPLVPLREAGMNFVRAGLTTEAEISRVIEAVEEQ